jgi:soluble lytic murein transglycosylase-like protein
VKKSSNNNESLMAWLAVAGSLMIFQFHNNSNECIVDKSQLPFKELIIEASRIYEVPADFLGGTISVESDFDPNARNWHSSAKGLGQLTRIVREEQSVENPFNPRENIFATAAHVAKMKKCFGPDRRDLWAAGYHSGTMAVIRNGYDIPPNSIVYVKKVLSESEKIRTKL